MYGRELGCTCRVYFMHLYVGPVKGRRNGSGVEARGPCGCHLDPWRCQNIQMKNRQGQKAWTDAWHRASVVAKKKIKELMAPIKLSLCGRASGLLAPAADPWGQYRMGNQQLDDTWEEDQEED